MLNQRPGQVAGTGWLLVGDHRIKKVNYDLTIREGASGHIGPADDRGSPLWLLENRHLVLELEDGQRLEIRTGTDGEIVVEGIS